jgi:hypothetical protein
MTMLLNDQYPSSALVNPAQLSKLVTNGFMESPDKSRKGAPAEVDADVAASYDQRSSKEVSSAVKLLQHHT